METIHLTRLASNCSMYATFQSHNQKVLFTTDGIVLSHLVDFDSAQNLCTWRLLKSRDGGASFACLNQSAPLVGNKPPCLEVAENGDILALCENGRSGKDELLFLRFRADRDFQDPAAFGVGPSHYGKFAMAYDRDSGTVFAWNHYGRLFILDPFHGVKSWLDVVQNNGPNAQTQYPHVFLDRDGLHHAWTTQRHAGPAHRSVHPVRWDIHYIRSTTQGRTWVKADGTKLALPIVPDDTGPADAIVLPDELEQETWLANMLVKEGKVHLAYLAFRSSQLPSSLPAMNRQHYVRLDLCQGSIDKNVYPEWRGKKISLRGSDSFFATRPGGPLVHVGRTIDKRIGSLISHDNGDSWHDMAISDPIPDPIYAIGGCREISIDGQVIGTFTAQRGEIGDPFYFSFKIA